MIIHVFGKVQGPTSTGDLHDEYFKNKKPKGHHLAMSFEYENETHLPV